MQNCDHLIALFAAMFSLSSRSLASEDSTSGGTTNKLSHRELHDLSLQYIHKALEACSSSAPPLCLLQALTLAGFYKLVNGVYGPAWRLVGSGVRIAYELRLHLIDCKGSDKAPTCDSELMAWSSNEERRRCWWALWEMDIFCSTITRTPTAVDWSANETCLPINDELWFANKYQASCLLQGSPEERWRRLKSSGNEDSFSWAMLLATLMHDGQLLCQDSIKGIIPYAECQDGDPWLAEEYTHAYKQKSEEFTARLSSLVRACQDVTENLPAKFSYGGESLSFGSVGDKDALAMRRISGGKHSIHMMTASACFMIYQNYVFADIIEGLSPLSVSKANNVPSGVITPNASSNAREGLQNYLKAGDLVVRLVASCPEGHERYVNPYYASTIWIAAALQVLKRVALRDNTSMLSQRHYGILRQSYLRYYQFWETPLALLQNLDSLDARLEARQKELHLSQGRVRTRHDDDLAIQGQTAGSIGEEAMIPPAYQQQVLQDLPGLSETQLETSQPSVNGPDGTFPNLLPEDVDWLATMPPGVDDSLSQFAFSGECDSAWSNELFMGDLAWYSTDVMAGLFDGYTV
ncbi:hypothetical protein EDD37DRAFT_289049 [Exophiala viscosa]|uniref:uncharacterized protein n=1 Tax=Exophiala viscosa TaxID=2486360 RepID=UPI00219F29DC|nr:hypothetical protein EDD37DRAFT_289049 [Exophiala viscosa]